jgi:hypothetical protein
MVIKEIWVKGMDGIQLAQDNLKLVAAMGGLNFSVGPPIQTFAEILSVASY